MLRQSSLQEVPVELVTDRDEGELERQLTCARELPPRGIFSVSPIRSNCVGCLNAREFIYLEHGPIENIR